ncbi:MAG: hypothetical protein PHC46_04820 [Clostridia bacterium]|nr:hypothetical protein [Clostridia bacterium]
MNKLKKWNNLVDGLIYEERKPQWQELYKGIQAKFVFKQDIELALTIMKMLDSEIPYNKIEKFLHAKRRTQNIKIDKPMQFVLYFSKQGTSFYKYFYKINKNIDTKIIRIEIENEEFKENNTNKKNLPDKEKGE